MRSHVIRLGLLVVLAGAFFVLGSSLSDCANATERTTCWKYGNGTKCRTETTPQAGRPYQPSKETHCWPYGAPGGFKCETR